MSEQQFARLIELNRARYCVALEEAFQHPRALYNGPADLDARPPRPIEEPEAIRALRPRQPPAPRPPPILGKGGPQHKYLQQLIKQLAEDRGLRAVIEEAVEGGQVDVGLHQGDLSVACEISITSTPEYEAQNLAKCLRAGFVRVWAIAPNAKRRKAVQAQAEVRLGAEGAARVEFLTTAELVEALDALSVPEPTEKIVKGYRVKSTRKAIPLAEAKARRAQIAHILARSMKGQADRR